MLPNLKAGHIDGFCAGEPWNSLAVHAKAGWIAATSAELDPGHPEKVLMTRAKFTVERPVEHMALVTALREACEFCAQPENRTEIAATLARPEFVGVPEDILMRGLTGRIDCGNGVARRIDDFLIFHRDGANEPSGDKAAWAMDLIRASGLCPEPAAINFSFARRIFRADIFEKACGLFQSHSEPAIA
jgi:ABC-type nitrate/sulfonate/bicarbonate transport system substrate-binding protein